MKKIVDIKNLRKVFCKGNICVANDINLFINEGEIFTILGKSGSGKTTFLRMIAGLETPDNGAPSSHSCLFLYQLTIRKTAWTVDSITVGPRIFLSTRTPMALAGTITEIDATAGVFAVEDDKGTAYVVEPTDCTSFVAGFDQ